MIRITRSLMDILNKIKRCKIFNFYSKCPSRFKMSKLQNVQNVHSKYPSNFYLKCPSSLWLSYWSFFFLIFRKKIRGSAEIRVGGKMGIWFCNNCMMKISDGLHVNNIVGYFRSSHQRSSIKIGVKILKISQENTCARVSFLIKLQATGILLY